MLIIRQLSSFALSGADGSTWKDKKARKQFAHRQTLKVSLGPRHYFSKVVVQALKSHCLRGFFLVE